MCSICAHRRMQRPESLDDVGESVQVRQQFLFGFQTVDANGLFRGDSRRARCSALHCDSMCDCRGGTDVGPGVQHSPGQILQGEASLGPLRQIGDTTGCCPLRDPTLSTGDATDWTGGRCDCAGAR
jgi:hypothetical protein